MKDIQHLLRVAVIFAAVVIGYLLVRNLLVPESFGKIGHYRADAVSEITTQVPRYAGEPACRRCHAKQASDKTKSGHRSVSCESCHGALGEHADNPKSDAGPIKPKEAQMRAFCGHCHSKSPSRPARFPQVDLEEHNRGVACNQCHQAHQPK